MPCHYQIFPQHHLVAKRFTGRVTARCVLKLLDDIESDARYRDGMFEFDDLTEVDDLAISATEIGNFADLIKGLKTRNRRPSKKAILAPHGPGRAAALEFGKLVEGAEDFEVGLFDHISEAFRFLNLEESCKVQRMLELKLKTV